MEHVGAGVGVDNTEGATCLVDTGVGVTRQGDVGGGLQHLWLSCVFVWMVQKKMQKETENAHILLKVGEHIQIETDIKDKKKMTNQTEKDSSSPQYGVSFSFSLSTVYNVSQN